MSNYSLATGDAVTTFQRNWAQISNPVSGGQCHLIHLAILRRFTWPSLAYMCTKVFTASPDYILFHIFYKHIAYQLLIMPEIKRDIDQQILK